MSNEKKIVNQLIDYIESLISQGFEEIEFENKFKQLLEEYMKEKLK